MLTDILSSSMHYNDIHIHIYIIKPKTHFYTEYRVKIKCQLMFMHYNDIIHINISLTHYIRTIQNHQE